MRTRPVGHANSHKRALAPAALRRETFGSRSWRYHAYRNGSSPSRATCPRVDCGHHHCGNCRIHKPESKSQHTHVAALNVDAMTFMPTAHIDFAASHYSDTESSDHIQAAIVAPSGLSPAAEEDVCDNCRLFKEADGPSHNINCHAKISSRDYRPCNGPSPANLGNQKCPDCDHLQVTCWILQIRRSERYSDRLPAMTNQVLKQWVKEQQLGHPNPPELSSAPPRFPRSPLHISALFGFLVLARVYLEMSYNPNALAQPGGQTALHMAAAGAQLPMVRLLLAWGADLEAKTASTRRTALQIAALRGHLDVCKFLIENGASLKAKDSQGKTAVELAHAGGHGETAEFLLKAGMRNVNPELKTPTPPIAADSRPMKLALLSPPALNRPTTTHPETLPSAPDWSNDSFSEGEYESGSSDGSESWEDTLPARQLHVESLDYRGCCVSR